MDFNKKYWIIIIAFFVFFMFYKPVFCFLMGGTIALIYAAHTVLFLNNIKKNGIETTAKISYYESDNEGYKTPIIEFQIDEEKTIVGKPYLHTSSDLDKFNSYQENIGKRVKIIYDAENPDKFILKNNSNGCGLIILIIAGLIFTGLSVGNLLGYNDIF